MKLCVTAALLVASGVALASDEQRGFTLYERFEGSSNTLGVITRLDSTFGYNFNRFVSVDAGAPVYFVRPSASALDGQTPAPQSGMGNVHASLRLNFVSPAISYLPSLTVTAPTGDKNKGLSTGKTTWDFNNHLERAFGRLTPFGEIGFANAVSDTSFFTRPYVSQGFVTHADGGAFLRLERHVIVGAAVYTINPSGEQTVISRLLPPKAQGNPAPGNSGTMPGNSGTTPGNGKGNGKALGRGSKPPAVWETAPETTGPADIARDRGFTTSLTIMPTSKVDLEIGYSRSTTYALDSLFFGVGVNLGSLFRKGRL